MFEITTPESIGVSSKQVLRFYKKLEQRRMTVHSVLMMRGDKIFTEAYWKPFSQDFCHRMYSVTKSFVGVAIGILEQEGKIKLTDKIADYFRDKIHRELPEWFENQTIRDMLLMSTCVSNNSWFMAEETDRVELYFNKTWQFRPSGTSWRYDSPGSQVLCELVERISGKSFFEFMKEKIFDYLGTFKTARMLKTKNDACWGDSAMICTTRDLASFGKFVMNYGTWEGKRLVNEEYLKTATSAVVSNAEEGGGFNNLHHVGYGYLIWRVMDNAFAFVGMGHQLMIAIPEKDLIFCCTSDSQGSSFSCDGFILPLYDNIIDFLGDEPLPEDKEAYAELTDYCSNLELRSLKDYEYKPMQDKINGKKYIVQPLPEGIEVLDIKNRTGIKEFTLNFTGDGEGELVLINAQGEKRIPFGMNKNVFGKFPQYGYYDEHGGVKMTNDFTYKDAVSATWRDDNKLTIFVQIIDNYFGNCTMNFSFRDEYATVQMRSNAEYFLQEYYGDFVAKMEE